ncbi:MAG TPA: hypothetical protein VH817_07235 [Thermoleophilaceae bacterium]
MTPNRIVAVLTPLVFAPLAGACASWLAQHFPGVDVSQSDLQAIFISGALIALAPAAQWLHGWQKYEARQADAETAVQVATAAGTAVPTLAAGAAMTDTDFEDDGDLTDLDDLDVSDELDELDALGDDDLDDDFEDDLLADEDEPAVTAS